MANNIAVTQYITNEILIRYLSQVKYVKTAYRGFDKQYKNLQYATGETLSYRLEENYTAEAGWVATPQDIIQRVSTITVDQNFHVMIALDGTELTLKRQADAPFLNERLLAKARALAEKAESTIAEKLKYSGYYTAGSPASPLNSISAINIARARMVEIGIPDDGMRYMALTPMASATIANSAQNYFNKKINNAAIMEGYLGHAAGFDFFETVFNTTQIAGSGDGTSAVAGVIPCGQINATVSSGNTIVLKGLPANATGVVKKGDVIRVDGSHFVHRTVKSKTTQLAQFVVQADAGANGSGIVTITVEPAIEVSGPYQIINTALQVNANVSLYATHDVSYAYHRNAIVFAAPPIKALEGGVISSRSFSDKYQIAMTNTVGADIRTYQNLNRMDMLIGSGINGGYLVRMMSQPITGN